MKRPINEIILHCTATPSNTTVESIRNYHVFTKGWSDIGYHFLVQNGKVITGRPVAELGAHCKGHNQNTIGIAYIGAEPTELDIETLAKLCNKLMSEYPITKITRHCRYDKLKTCPNFDEGHIDDFDKICKLPLQ